VDESKIACLSGKACLSGISTVTIEIRTELKANYARFSCSGSFDFDSFMDMVHNAFEFAANEGKLAVLVDVRGLLGEAPSVGERYDFGVRVAELQRGVGKSILIAVTGNEPFVDPDRLAEIVARSHGAFVAVFTEIDEAIDWIEAEVEKIRTGATLGHLPSGSS
jgi:hypothetical protein